MVNTRKGGGVDQPGNDSARQLTRREKAMAIRERNKKKVEEAAAKARERAAATAAAGVEEGEEEDEEDDHSQEITQVVEKNSFNTSAYKLEGNTALKIILEKDFPKLIGPSNFEEWHRAFKRAMVLSNYWGFFSEDYNDASATTWHKLGKQKAVEFIKESCSKDKELEIIDAHDPATAYNTLVKNSKPIGNSRFRELQKEWQNTTMASCGSAKEFKAVLLNINRRLLQLNPKYAKSTWDMNSWFINNLTDAFEHKVSALSSDPSVISVENPMSFDDLTLQIVEEEQRLFGKYGEGSVVAAAKDVSYDSLDNNTLLTKIKDASKEMRQIRQILHCARCNKKGHLDIDGQYGCFNRPGNEKYRDAAFKGKRRRGNDSDRESIEKKRKVEKHDFTQNIVIEQTYGPDLDK
jgi:hypothetical protein